MIKSTPGLVIITSLLSFSLHLLSLAPQASAIGGWETSQILLAKELSEHSKKQTKEIVESTSKTTLGGEVSPDLNILSSASSTSASSASPSGNLKDIRKGKKRRHTDGVAVNEVNMMDDDKNNKKDDVTTIQNMPLGERGGVSSVAFVSRSRRGGLTLDEKDLERISFVGRSPFL